MQTVVAKSKVTRAHSKYSSLRTAIPWEYVVSDREMKLKEGDYLVWERRVIDGERVLTVRKERK